MMMMILKLLLYWSNVHIIISHRYTDTDLKYGTHVLHVGVQKGYVEQWLR